MARKIQQEYFFPHPPETVWEYLTTAELMSQWLMPNDFKPVVGHKFNFRTGGRPSLNFDGIFHCKVLTLDPYTNLSYSWDCGPGNGEINLESVVYWTLQPKENGTHVSLEHTGFSNEQNIEMFNGFTHGWPEKYGNIVKLMTERYGNTSA